MRACARRTPSASRQGGRFGLAGRGLLVALAASCGDGSGPEPGEPPTGPSDLRITAVGDWEWRLDWTDNADNESGFHVYYQFDGTSEWLYTTLPPDSTSMTAGVPGIGPGTTYRFTVYAFDARTDTESERYASASLTTPAPAIIVVSPDHLDFAYTQGGPVPLPQFVSVTNGRPEISLIGLTLFDGSSGWSLPPWDLWLSPTLNATVAPTTVTLSAALNTDDMRPGVYRTKVPVRSPVAATVEIEVSLTIHPG